MDKVVDLVRKGKLVEAKEFVFEFLDNERDALLEAAEDHYRESMGAEASKILEGEDSKKNPDDKSGDFKSDKSGDGKGADTSDNQSGQKKDD